jgi:hypothetical protein
LTHFVAPASNRYPRDEAAPPQMLPAWTNPLGVTKVGRGQHDWDPPEIKNGILDATVTSWRCSLLGVVRCGMIAQPRRTIQSSFPLPSIGSLTSIS